MRHSSPIIYSSAQRYGTKRYYKIVSVILQAIYLVLLEGQELFLNVWKKGKLKKKKVAGGSLNLVTYTQVLTSVTWSSHP